MTRRIFCVLLLSTAAWAAEQRAKNVILFIADAGGIPTIHAASIHGYGEPHKLFIHRMPHHALMETSTASAWVTDSAAGMTAIVTGQKTHSGVISQSASATRGKQDGEPLKTILEYAEERGLSSGVITNSPVTDATPAACYAHSNDRKTSGEIFAQILSPRFGDGVDIVIGPGRKNILAATQAMGLDIESGLKKKGFVYTDSVDAIPASARRAVALLDSAEFDLDAAVFKAISILSRNPKGYFLMVESDTHTNNLKRGLDRMVAVDKIVQKVVETAGPDTLVIFTADHSFDLRMRGGKRGEPIVQENKEDSKAAPAIRVDNGHTGEEVLVAAQGPGAHRVKGFIANTDLFRIMMAAYGW